MRSCIKSLVQQSRLVLIRLLSKAVIVATAAYVASAENTPISTQAATSEAGHGATESIDWRIGAYVHIAEMKYVADQESLARIANWRLRYGTPHSQAEFTSALLDELSQERDTLLSNIPVSIPRDNPDGVPEKLNEVEPGPASHHDLTTLRGRSAFVLERMYDIALPPCKRSDSSKRRRAIQNEAIRQIIRSKLQSEVASVKRLNKEERLRLATSTRTSNVVLEALADDPDSEVLIALANNYGRPPSAGKKLRRRMELETDPDVKKALKDALWRVHSYFPDPAPDLRDRPPRQELVKQAEEKIKNDSSTGD